MTGSLLAAAVAFVWFGMVVAISFLEAPLKFRAPGITTALGLGIGRLVFAALNTAEVILAVGATVGLIWAGTWSVGTGWLLAAIAALVVQLLAVRPALRRRTARVLAGDGSGARSHAHGGYVVLELIKAGCLLTGALLLIGS